MLELGALAQFNRNKRRHDPFDSGQGKDLLSPIRNQLLIVNRAVPAKRRL